MKIGAIVQARVGSSRLRGKVLMRINGKTMLQIIIEKLKKIAALDEIVIATTTGKEDRAIEKIALQNKVHCFMGSEANVLQRFAQAAEKHGLDVIVRVSADDPLISTQIIKSNLKKFLQFKNLDYFFVRGFPRGFGSAEIVSTKALVKANQLAYSKRDKEHVVTFIVDNPELFNVRIEKAPQNAMRPDLRVTIDTKADLVAVEKICAGLGTTDIKAERLIGFLEKHPAIAGVNKGVKQKNAEY